MHPLARVAPHAGARIETFGSAGQRDRGGSPLTQGRGSKPTPDECHAPTAWSPLTQGRGSKLDGRAGRDEGVGSPLTQGRGSKHGGAEIGVDGVRSPLTQGRGSKRPADHPASGARCRPSRRGADRNARAFDGGAMRRGRPLRRGADRNGCPGRRRYILTCRPLRRGADRNPALPRQHDDDVVAPYAGARIETDVNTPISLAKQAAPHAGARIETRSRPRKRRAVASPLTQGRGSKLVAVEVYDHEVGRASRRGADRNVSPHASHRKSGVAPTQGRGSKPSSRSRTSTFRLGIG